MSDKIKELILDYDYYKHKPGFTTLVEKLADRTEDANFIKKKLEQLTNLGEDSLKSSAINKFLAANKKLYISKKEGDGWTHYEYEDHFKWYPRNLKHIRTTFEMIYQNKPYEKYVLDGVTYGNKDQWNDNMLIDIKEAKKIYFIIKK